MPSFVVTLAGLLICQGMIIYLLGTQGVIGIQDKQINDVANYVLTKNTGWIVAIVFTAILAGGVVRRLLQPAARRPADREPAPDRRPRRLLRRPDVRRGRRLQPLARRAARRADLPLRGRRSSRTSPARTTFGRHVYAVGGNAEAARRAGINVEADPHPLLRHLGRLAGLGGVILASRLNSVDLTFGGGTLLLDAISAAVIGGVSLFGGRGRVSGALFGGLIIGMISNGTDLVGSADWVKYVTTGVILLAAVTLDTVARRRQVAAGR